MLSPITRPELVMGMTIRAGMGRRGLRSDPELKRSSERVQLDGTDVADKMTRPCCLDA